MQYIETFFGIPCDYEGERYHYMLYSWVNRDWLAYLGRAVGMLHKIAKVQMTWAGDADVIVHDAEAEEVLPFKPRRVLGGWYFTILYNHLGSTPQLVYRFEEEQ